MDTNRYILSLHIAWLLLSCCRCCNVNITLSPGEQTEITSPNFGPGQKYPKSTDCTWHIVSSLSEKLIVTFHTFDVEFHVSCAWDYVEIRNGSCEAGSGQRLCGSSLPVPYVTSVKSLCIHFFSDVVAPRAGFNLTVSAAASNPSSSTSPSTTTTIMTSSSPAMTTQLPHIDCQDGVQIITKSVTISTPGFGVNPTYPNNVLCVWVVELQENQEASITFDSFELESHPYCGYDWLKVLDGPHSTSSVKEIFCGSTLPPLFTLSKSTCLKFKSDVIVPKAGFFARIDIKTSSSTSSYATSPPTLLQSMLTSSSHPLGPVTSETSSLTSSQSTPTSTFMSSTSAYIQTTSSTSKTSSQPSSSTSSSSLSSSSTSASPPKIFYVEMCNDVNDVEGVRTTMLLSPGYQQGLYPVSTSCDITIHASLGQRLLVSVLEFELELHPTCLWDSLTIIEGSCSSGTTLGKYCGSSLANNFTSTNDILCFKFVSDFIVPKPGFKIVIQSLEDTSTKDLNIKSVGTTVAIVSTEDSFISTNSLQKHSSETASVTSPNAPTSTDINLTSPVLLSSPSTSSASSTSSSSVFLSVLTSVSSSSPSSLSSSMSTQPLKSTTKTTQSTHVFSSSVSSSVSTLSPLSSLTQTPTALTSSSSSSSLPSSTTTSMTVTPLQTVALCSKESVTVSMPMAVTSPNFGPGLFYPLKKTCTLCMSSAQARRLQISFSEFDVELHPSCAWDSLTVYDGSSTTSPVLATLCGGLHQTENFTSSSNSLCLKFVSDFMAPKHGFRALVEPSYLPVTLSKPATKTTGNTPPATSTPDADVSTTMAPSLTSPTTSSATTASLLSKILQSNITEQVSGSGSDNDLQAVTTHTPTPANPATPTPGIHAVQTTTELPSIKSSVPSFVSFPSTTSVSTNPPTTTDNISQSLSSTSGSAESSSKDATTTITTTTTTADAKTDLQAACSGVPLVLTSESGTITSPGFPAPYPNSLDCQWIIDAHANEVIQITFTSFELEFNHNCDWDSLTIHNGDDVTDEVIVKLCSGDLPDNITTSGGQILFHLHTDRVVSKSGFNLTYHALQSSTTESVPLTCPGGSFPCNNGTCIPKEWLCDGDEDCEDGEDEQECGQCRGTEFQCDDGSCLASYRRCDGKGDCNDMDDEDHCVTLDSNDRNGTLLIMRSGTWFPVCFDQWEAQFSDAACLAADFGPSINLESVESSSDHFLIPAEYLSLDMNQLHNTLKLESSCHNGQVVSLTCQPRECGIKSDSLPSAYILGGSRAVRGEWPWVVSLMSGTRMVCGATVIGERWVVTAGHCVETLLNSPQTTYIVAGNVNVKSPDIEYLRVTEIILHPDHNFIYNADIALVHLQRPLVFSDRVKPLCLPTRQHKWSTSLPCYIAGWGVTIKQNVLSGITSPYLHHAKLRLWQQATCRDIYKTKVKDTMICAGHEYGEVDACKGDSGSPLMCRTSPDKWEFVGVTSWGEGCGLIGKPGVYTRVDHYLTWINEQMIHLDEVNCDFESPSTCGYEDTSNSHYIWTRRKGGMYIPERPYVDSTLGTQDGHYMYAFIPYEAKHQIATLTSPPFHNSGFSCLTFSVTFLNAKDAKLRVYGASNSSADMVLLMQLSQVQGHWRLVEHELKGDVMRVLFVAEAGRYTNGGVGLDDVTIEDGRCEGFLKVNCDFDDGTFCEYLQAEDDTYDWDLKPVKLLEDNSRASPGHSTEHYIEANGTSRNPGDTTRVLSPTLNSTVPQCIRFKYKIHPAHAGSLSVCTESVFQGQVFLSCNMWSRSNSVDNDWTEGHAQKPASSYPYRIGFQAKRGSVAGIIAIDNLSKTDGVCHL